MRRIVIGHLLFLLLTAFSSSVSAGGLDSLEKSLAGQTSKRERVNILCKLSYEYLLLGQDARAFDSAKVALRISEESGYKQGMIDARAHLADYYDAAGNHETAINYYETALRLAKAEKAEESIARVLMDMGSCYRAMGNYQKALGNFLEVLSFGEEKNKKEVQASALNQLGIVYYYLKDIDKALASFRRCVQLRSEMGDAKGVASTYGNMANIFREMSQPDTALVYLLKARKVYEQLGAKRNLSFSENAMGLIYTSKGDYEKALEHYRISLALKQGFSDKQGVAITMNNIAVALDQLGKVEEAEKNYLEGLRIFQEIGAEDYVKDSYWSLAGHYHDLKDYKKAYDYLKMYTLKNDSIFSKESARQLSGMEARYESEKKENAIQLLTKEKEVQELAINKQTQQKNFLIAGVVLVLLLGGVLFNRYQLKNRSHRLLEDQNKIIAQKNKDITDSINYAKRIQDSMLPSLEQVKRSLPGAFILFKPKDIVSGDFYWYAERKGKVYIAAVDCTGHGVPGAFMSMIGNDKLNHAVVEKQLTEPSDILFSLNQTVKAALQQDQKGHVTTKDGMDLALCIFDLPNKRLHFGGANRPLYMVRNGELQVMAPTKASIAGGTGSEQNFASYMAELQPGDCYYIFSDGYADQFGGADGKKMMTGRFKELLTSVAELEVKEQQRLLDKHFDEWRGSLEQVDDVLVIGIKI